MDADADGPGPTLLAAAETDDVRNVDSGRREEAEEEAELCPRLSLVTTEHPAVGQNIGAAPSESFTAETARPFRSQGGISRNLLRNLWRSLVGNLLGNLPRYQTRPPACSSFTRPAHKPGSHEKNPHPAQNQL